MNMLLASVFPLATLGACKLASSFSSPEQAQMTPVNSTKDPRGTGVLLAHK